jgi:hypothetical protein
VTQGAAFLSLNPASFHSMKPPDAERMQSEGLILKQNPLLINKIVAERLSDKLQIMMVPADGKFFFANDVLRSMNMANHTSQAEEPETPPQN